MEEINNVPTRRVIRISKKAIWISVIVLIVLLFGLSFVVRMITSTFGTGPEQISRSMIPCIPGPGIDCGGGYYSNNSSVTDTREFMKMSYDGNLKTRKVEEVARDVKDAIRDAKGRIDNQTVATQYAHINFVIPESEFDDFKDEIKSLTYAKLYTDRIDSDNKLSTKQQIEEEDKNASMTLAQLQKEKKDLDTAHTKKIASLEASLRKTNTELNDIRKAISVTDRDNAVAYDNLVIQEQNLINSQSTILSNTNNENFSYNDKSTRLNEQISTVNSNLVAIDDKDKDFMQDIATVNGSVEVRFITHWEMAKIYAPIHPTFIIIILVILGWIFLRHKPYVPKVEFV